MLISFWSHCHQLGSTHNIAAVAVFTALEYRMRTLVMHTHFDTRVLEAMFVEPGYLRHELTELSNTGIDALNRFIKFNRLEKDAITSFATTILKNRLDLLIGNRNTNLDIFSSSLRDTITCILQSAGQVYDLVFTDIVPGENEVSMKVLSASDLIVVNLSQNIYILDEYLSQCYDFKDRVMILIGKYDDDSRFNLKFIRKKFGAIQVQVIPYDIGFVDACMENRCVDFFIKNLSVDREDIHFPFITGVRETAEAILTRLGITLSQKKVQVRNGHE